MNIILKGIDLPRNQTIIIHYADRYGEMETVFVDENNIIQIPKGHGRLVDIEKLKEEFAMKNNICKECDSFKECDNKTYSKSEICEKFIWVPTILEAEEIK